MKGWDIDRLFLCVILYFKVWNYSNGIKIAVVADYSIVTVKILHSVQRAFRVRTAVQLHLKSMFIEGNGRGQRLVGEERSR